MRKQHLFYASALAIGLALGACNNENEPQVVDLGRPIDLNIGLQASTKVAIENPTGFDTGDAVGVYLATSDDNAQAAVNSGEAVNNVQFSLTADGWSGEIYWQNTSQYHTLYAYYPYDASLNGTQTQKAVSVVADQHADGGLGYKAADYLWGVNAPVKATESSQLMELKHKMARVKVTLKPGNDMTADKVDAIAASLQVLGTDIPTAGTFDVAKGIITANQTQDAPLASLSPYYTGADGNYTYYAIMLPGTQFTKGADFVKVTATDGTTYAYKLDTQADLVLEEGKEYVFDLLVNKASLGLGGFYIYMWQSDGGWVGGNIDMVVP